MSSQSNSSPANMCLESLHGILSKLDRLESLINDKLSIFYPNINSPQTTATKVLDEPNIASSPYFGEMYARILDARRILSRCENFISELEV